MQNDKPATPASRAAQWVTRVSAQREVGSMMVKKEHRLQSQACQVPVPSMSLTDCVACGM